MQPDESVYCRALRSLMISTRYNPDTDMGDARKTSWFSSSRNGSVQPAVASALYSGLTR